MPNKRALTVGLIGLVVLVGAVVIVQRVRDDRRGNDACDQSVADAQVLDDANPVTTGDQTIVVLGDSYSAGSFLADPLHEAWPVVMGELLHATVIIDGIGGTGFTNGGFCFDDQYATRTERVLSIQPDLVVVEGGLNDAEAPPADITAAAAEVLDQLSGTPVVLVGPTNAPAKPNAPQVDAALAQACAEADDCRYVSALGWDVELGADQLHPTAAGHRAFAEQIAAALAP
jgi:lysophospholipase L1-like esterase